MSDVDFTDIKILIDKQEQNCKELLYEQQRVFDWFAAQDIVYWDDDKLDVVKRSSAEELAKSIGVSRQTIYNWRKTIPNAEQRIKSAKYDILQSNIGAVWNSIFIKACEGDFSAITLYLSNFDPSFIMPGAKTKTLKEPKIDGLTDLLNQVRDRL